MPSDLQLNDLSQNIEFVSPGYGEFMKEACAVCLDLNGHESGVSMVSKDDIAGDFRVVWAPPVDDALRTSHGDKEETAEYAAYAIALLLVRQSTEFKYVERSMKGTRFDYRLGKTKDELFQNKACLEVSGILRGTEPQIASRLTQKLQQVKKRDSGDLAFVVIVEFGRPISRVKRHDRNTKAA